MMTNCMLARTISGEACRLLHGHAGPCLPVLDPRESEMTTERRRLLQVMMTEQLSSLFCAWRAQGAPWYGIAGHLLGDVVLLYRYAGAPVEDVARGVATLCAMVEEQDREDIEPTAPGGEA